MRQRLAIAEILVKEPKIAFLDEPTLGLDPEGTNLIIDYIQGLSRESNMTILLSSHDLTQVQKIANRIGIMIHGKLIAEGPIEKLAHEKLGVEDKEIPLDEVYMKYFKEVTS
jgi:ABC-2 type transport system ATP-binding protein